MMTKWRHDEIPQAENLQVLLKSRTDVTIQPGDTKIIPTGCACELPRNTCAILGSSLRNHITKGIKIVKGIIDEDYRGEVCVILTNVTGMPYDVSMGTNIDHNAPTPDLWS